MSFLDDTTNQLLACYILIGVLSLIILMYVSFELHYFMRTFLTIVLARLFKQKVHILQETSVRGICLTTDVDALLYHMNNARYLREMDFARIDFYERTGLYNLIRRKGGGIVQGACTIRYRKFIKTFAIYKITTRIVYWDEKSIFMEQRFITPKTNFINAIALCRQRIIKCNADEVMNILLTKQMPKNTQSDIEMGQNHKIQQQTPPSSTIGTIIKPEMPADIKIWNEYNELSSANLRNSSS